MAEKRTEQLLIRLTPTLLDRLNAASVQLNLEKTELVRSALEADLSRRELDATLAQVRRLQDAGVDLKAMIDYALAVKALEDAQHRLPGIFNAGGRP
jgi:predicted DNA-binding protein